MELVNLLYEFFGFDTLSAASTLVDLLQLILKVGCGMWLTIFIIRSLFLATTVSRRGF